MSWVKSTRTFIDQVIQESRKVIWPTRRDVFLTSIIVVVLASIVAIFLFAADQVLVALLRIILGVSSRG